MDGIAGVVDELVLFDTSAATATLAGDPSVGTASPDGDGCASLAAAHATEAISVNGMTAAVNEILLNKLLCIS